MPYIGNSPGTGTRNRFIYTATASQTTFSGADDNGKTLKYSDSDYVDVYLNGICLVPVTDYTSTSKTSIVLTQAASLNDTLEVVAYDIATISDTVSKADGGTFEANVNFTEDARFGSGNTSSVSVGNGTGAIQVADTTSTALTAMRYASSSAGPFIMMGKTRSATVGTVGSVVSDGDDLGTIRFAGDDGTDVNSVAATIRAEVDGTPGSNDMPGRLLFETTADGAASSTERMRIDSTGNVFINNGVLYLDDDGSHNGIINSPASLRVNVDSDAGATGESFQVGTNATNIDGSNILHKVQDNGAIYQQLAGAGGFQTGHISVGHVGSDSSGTADIKFFVDFTNTSGTYDTFIIMLYLAHAGNSAPIESAVYRVQGYQRLSSLSGLGSTLIDGGARPITLSSSGLTLTITVGSEGSSTATQGGLCRVVAGRYGFSDLRAGTS